MRNLVEFIEETKGLVWGDIVNGVTGDDTETILAQVKANPSASDPDEGFFFTVPVDEEPNEDNTTGYSLRELCDILGIEVVEYE